MLAHKGVPIDGHGTLGYGSFDHHPIGVRARGGEGLPIVRVALRPVEEGETSPYWAWWEVEDQRYNYVYPNRLGTEMCFAYGSQVEEERGRGKLVNVVVEELPS